MVTRSSPTIRFRTCQRCGGDAYLDAMDEPEWRCLQCARPVPAQPTAQVVVSTSTLKAA